jgi:hypothetical protein
MTIGSATAVEFVVMASNTSSVHQFLAHGFASIAPATLRRFDSIASEAQSSIINKSPDIKIPQEFADIPLQYNKELLDDSLVGKLSNSTSKKRLTTQVINRKLCNTGSFATFPESLTGKVQL